MSIGDSNVVDGADVNPPSADAGPDPCVLNHDVVPVVPDVPVSTEAMMHCTARRGIMEIPDRPLCSLNHGSWIRSINGLPARSFANVAILMLTKVLSSKEYKKTCLT